MERVKNLKFKPKELVIRGNFYKVLSVRTVGLIEDGICGQKEEDLILHLTYGECNEKPKQTFVKIFEMKIRTGTSWLTNWFGLGGYSYVTVAIVIDDIFGKLKQEIIPITEKHKSILMLIKHIKNKHRDYQYVENLFNPHIACILNFRSSYNHCDLSCLHIYE